MRINLLDHGYARLVDHWGRDINDASVKGEAAIIAAARMSTGKGFLGWGDCDKPGDEKLLRFLWDNKHCYDAQTEVLTTRGFVCWPDVRTDDRLGQWDEAAQTLVYEKPLELISHRHQGRMYRVDHGGVDLLVTDNHRMFVKQIVSAPGENRQAWSDDWRLVSASDLDQRSMIRYRKHAACNSAPPIDLCDGRRAPIFPEHQDSRALLRLIGFFVGDGHAGGSYANAIGFHLKKSRKVAFLREVCAEIGWGLAELANNQYVVRAEGLTQFFRSQFYGAKGEKVIPSYLLGLNAEDATAMLDGLRASDGSTKRGAWEYFSTSKQVADAVQLLVLHAGGAAHVHCSDGYMHRVMVMSRMIEPVINQGKKNTSWQEYDGFVYCAHTRTGVLVVRRNGKIVLSGNSTPFEFCGLTVEVQAPIFVFREWHRHRVPFGYAEASARYTPLPDTNYVPTVERLMMQGGANKQASSTGAILTRENAERYCRRLAEAYASDEALYQDALTAGVPKELARVHLPVGRYSRMRATANLRGWIGFLALREAPGAQYEIRVYANAVSCMLKELFPRTHALYVGSE
jgi:thymidylate synthase (FAD)